MEYKTIVITGATSGIGEMLAKKLVSKNCVMILTGRNKNKLLKLSKELSKIARQVIIYPMDLLNQSSIYKFSRLIAQKKVTILINSAADFGPVKNILNVSNEEVIDGFRTNVLAPISLTQAVLSYMLENNYGRIINIGSTGGLGGYPLRAPYCLSKNALIAFTKTLNGEIASGEYGKYLDIKSFCVCPGPVKGARLEKQIRSRAKYKKISSSKCREKFTAILGRVLEGDEVCDRIINLLRPGDDFKGQDVITF